MSQRFVHKSLMLKTDIEKGGYPWCIMDMEKQT